MSNRKHRPIPGSQTITGMPDSLTLQGPAGQAHKLNKTPPKSSETDRVARTLDEAIARSCDILNEALAQHAVVGRYWLFSGGNDSVIVGHLLRGRFDAVLHVNTGTGIPETTQHVRDVATAWCNALHELHPKNSYEDLVMGRVIASRGANAGVRPVWRGFPGPPGHKVMYRHLKDEPLMTFRRSVLGDQTRLSHKDRRKIVYLGGMRWGETERRFRNAEAIDADGSIVWVSPLVHWTNAHMNEYRARHRCLRDHEHAPHHLCFPGALPLNEVTEHIHMSGECLCGAYAKPGELDEIGFFYPAAAGNIRALQRRVEDAGIKNCRWGQKNGPADAGPAGRLCSSCVEVPGQADLLDQWHADGLLTEAQYTGLTTPPA